VTRTDVRTDEGLLDCYVFTPESMSSLGASVSVANAWPPVLLYMDAFGIRPQLADMAQRLASNGYCVVAPNLYYRSGEYAPFDQKLVSVEGPERDRFKGMIRSITDAMVMRDTAAVLAMIDTHRSARPGPVGAVGYCMGGGFALSAAGTFPERVAAALSFHGGSLATDKADSAHLLAGRIRARVYVGVAEIDASFSPDQQHRLETALSQAGVDYTIETYKGARHGFAVTGHLVYDRDASERHWQKLVQVLRETLHTPLS
jgi:carboxymethylenebutenolidase